MGHNRPWSRRCGGCLFGTALIGHLIAVPGGVASITGRSPSRLSLLVAAARETGAPGADEQLTWDPTCLRQLAEGTSFISS
jgi:hypothetical protein